MSKSIPAAKSQNFVNISGAQNPHGHLKKQVYIDITRRKINLWSHNIHAYNAIADRIVFISPKKGKGEILLFLGSSISHFCLR